MGAVAVSVGSRHELAVGAQQHAARAFPDTVGILRNIRGKQFLTSRTENENGGAKGPAVFIYRSQRSLIRHRER